MSRIFPSMYQYFKVSLLNFSFFSFKDNKDIDSSDISFVPISKEILKKEKVRTIAFLFFCIVLN